MIQRARFRWLCIEAKIELQSVIEIGEVGEARRSGIVGKVACRRLQWVKGDQVGQAGRRMRSWYRCRHGHGGIAHGREISADDEEREESRHSRDFRASVQVVGDDAIRTENQRSAGGER